MAPAAVRMVELEQPLTHLRLPQSRVGQSYRSLLSVARLDGDPLGTAVVSVDPGGLVPRDRLAVELRRQLETELAEAFARRGLELPPALPPEGVPGTSPRRPCQPSARGAVSVVVTTCRDPVPLERCLRSILASDYDDFEVIVVENRPGSPATRMMLAEKLGNHPRLRYVEEPCRGLSRARNAGLSLAGGDLVAFTDDDVVVDPAWVHRCAQAFHGARDIACVTGLILPLELETDSQLMLEQFAGFGKGFGPRTYRFQDGQEADPLALYTPGAIGSGANTVLRADVAWQLGGFDTSLGAGTPAAGGEDLDLYIRLLRDGHAVAYEPGAIVWHQHRDGAVQLRRQVYGYGVGLGAMLAKQLFAGPERQQLLRAVPAGIRYVRDPDSRKNVRKTAAYPWRLDWLERLGIVIGPAAFAVSALANTLRRCQPLCSDPAVALQKLDAELLVLSSDARRRREAASPVERALTLTALAACLAAPLLVALGLPAQLRLPAVLALLCLAPGTALVIVLRGRLEPGLVVGSSLATSAVLAQSMLWLHAWWPKPFLYGLAAVCLPPLVGRQLDVAGRGVVGHSRAAEAPATGASPPTRLERLREAMARIPRSAMVHGALLTCALAAWATSLAGAHLNRISGIGLLTALPPTYFVAFGLLLIGFPVAVSRDEIAPKLLGLYVLALILVLHGTTPFLYDEPRYVATYKHLGVISLIGATGHTYRDLDVYNNWPGFFAASALLSGASGLKPIAYAAWAQVFFNLASVAALRFALRGLTGDERLLWTAVWLFVLANWLGQDYLAPQAFAFVISVVVFGLCLRCGPTPRLARFRTARWRVESLSRLRALRARGAIVPDVGAPAPLSSRGAVVAGGLGYLAVVVSHQLSPIVLILGATALFLTRRLPLWVPAAMTAIEAWWVALAWPFIRGRYDLFGTVPDNLRPPGYEPRLGLPGQELVSFSARASVAIIALLALAGFVRRLRAGRWDLAAGCMLVTAGAAAFFGLSAYGTEASFRSFLFALPWLCFFAAAALYPIVGNSVPRLLRAWSLTLASCALGACLLLAYFGLELRNRVPRDDVLAATWYERHAPPNSRLVFVAPSFPSRLTADYPRVQVPTGFWSPNLTDAREFRGHQLGTADLPKLNSLIEDLGTTAPVHVVLSRGQEQYARLYGLLPDGSFGSLALALAASRSFRLIYRRGSSWIYEYRPTSQDGGRR